MCVLDFDVSLSFTHICDNLKTRRILKKVCNSVYGRRCGAAGVCWDQSTSSTLPATPDTVTSSRKLGSTTDLLTWQPFLLEPVNRGKCMYVCLST